MRILKESWYQTPPCFCDVCGNNNLPHARRGPLENLSLLTRRQHGVQGVDFESSCCKRRKTSVQQEMKGINQTEISSVLTAVEHWILQEFLTSFLNVIPSCHEHKNSSILKEWKSAMKHIIPIGKHTNDELTPFVRQI